MTQNSINKSPLEYLSDVVEYRDNPTESNYENIDNFELIRENILLFEQQIANSTLTPVEREKITVILLGLLYHPFLCLNLEPIKECKDLNEEALYREESDDESNDNLSTVCSIVQMIAGIHENLYRLFDSIRDLMRTQERMFLEMDLSYKTMLYSISVISYIGYGLEKTVPDNCHFYPNVLSGQYILIRHLPLINLLLSRKDEQVNNKGLVLSCKLLKRIKPETLDSTVLDLLIESPIDNALIKIMKYSCNRYARLTALSVFKLLINCFKLPTRCQLLFKILANPDHEQGIQRLILSVYKDFFVYESDWKPFIGNNLNHIIRKSVELSLPDRENSDLAENYDSICTILNFIRYLLLRDKYDLNETKIWSMIDSLKRDCIDLVWRAIQVSKVQYKARLHELEQPAKRNLESNGVIYNMEVFNGSDEDTSEMIPDISEDQEKESLTCGLINLELTESLVKRINEIINEARLSGR